MACEIAVQGLVVPEQLEMKCDAGVKFNVNYKNRGKVGVICALVFNAALTGDYGRRKLEREPC